MEAIAVITVFVLALTMALLRVKAEPWWFCIPLGFPLVLGIVGSGSDLVNYFPVPLFASMFLAIAVLTERLRPRSVWHWAIVGVYYGMGLGLWLVVERPLLALADPTGRILYLQAGLLLVVALPLLGFWVTQRLWGGSERQKRSE